MNFKQRFIAPILSGEKTQTLRRGTSMKPGDEVACYCRWGESAFATVRVTRVTTIRRDQLRKADATADGFVSKVAMLAYIDGLYGRLPRFARVEFELQAPPP